MNIEIITTLKDIEKIRPEWLGLFESNNSFSVFEHFEWIYQKYCETGEDKILLLLVYDDVHNLAGIFPFVIAPLFIKKLEFKAIEHAAGPSADYSSFLLDKKLNRKVAIKRVVQKLIEIQPGKWTFYNICNLSSEDDNARLFASYLEEMIYGCLFAREMTYNINFNEPFGESKKISNVKRRFSKLQNSGNVRVFIDAPVEQKILGQFVLHHGLQFSDTGFNTEKSQKFFNHLINQSDFSRYIEMSYILDGNDLVAGHFGFKHKSCLYYYVPVYNDKYKQYGPGQFLLMQMINHYKNLGFSKFDFLRGSEAYKDNWANTVDSNLTVFGVPENTSLQHRILVNIWIVKKLLPLFKSK